MTNAGTHLTVRPILRAVLCVFVVNNSGESLGSCGGRASVSERRHRSGIGLDTDYGCILGKGARRDTVVPHFHSSRTRFKNRPGFPAIVPRNCLSYLSVLWNDSWRVVRLPLAW